jgi:hypothetical protein
MSFLGLPSDNEDLSQNVFFKSLREQYTTLYSESEKNCWLICVPQASACAGLKITKDIIGKRIFINLFLPKFILFFSFPYSTSFTLFSRRICQLKQKDGKYRWNNYRHKARIQGTSHCSDFI